MDAGRASRTYHKEQKRREMDCSQLTRSSFLVSWYGLGGQIPRHGLGIGSSHRRYGQQGYNVSTLETAGFIPPPPRNPLSHVITGRAWGCRPRIRHSWWRWRRLSCPMWKKCEKAYYLQFCQFIVWPWFHRPRSTYLQSQTKWSIYVMFTQSLLPNLCSPNGVILRYRRMVDGKPSNSFTS